MKMLRDMKMNKRIRNNKGFSLIEIIIAIAIVSIVSVAIVLAMTSSSRVYSRSSVEAQMQSEAQLVANAVSEIGIDASNASNEVTTEWVNSLTADDKLMFGNAAAANPDLPQLLVYLDTTNPNPGNFVVFDAVENFGTAAVPSYRKVQYVIAKSTASSGKSENGLYLAKRNQDDSGDWLALSEFSLLGSYVSDFTVDTTRVETDNLLNFKLTYTKNSREYVGNYQVLMRNRAYAKAEPEEVPSESDIKLVANIQPKYIYLAVRQGTIPDFYEGAVVDTDTYHRIMPSQFVVVVDWSHSKYPLSLCLFKICNLYDY